MQHGNNLDRSSSFPHAVDNQIGIRRPEEHLFGGEIRTRVARMLPLCQVLEGGKQFVNDQVCGSGIVGRDKVLDSQKIFERFRRKFIGSHASLLLPRGPQPGACVFRVKRLTLFELLKGPVNLFANLDQPSLSCQFLLFQQAQRLSNNL